MLELSALTVGENNMTDDELKALAASLAVDSKNLHEAQRVTDEKMKLNAIAQKVNEELIASLAIAQQESTRKLDKLGELYGNVGKNQSDVAEEFFLNSLLKDNHLGSVYFDDVTTNMGRHRGQIQEEYDLDKLDRKMQNFKKLFPIYQNYKQYGTPSMALLLHSILMTKPKEKF
jgi:hypothetical protein